MCNIDNSNLWEKESKLLYKDDVNIPTTNVSVDDKFLSDDFFRDNFMHLKQVNFLGGEPLIIKEHTDLAYAF